MSKTLLLVEDDHIIQDLVESAVQKMNLGIVVKKAMNTNIARSMVQMYTFDFFMVDIILPDGDGFTLVKELRKKYTHTPLIIESTKKDIKTVNHAFEDLKCLSFLKKPFSEAEVISSIENILGLKEFFKDPAPKKRLTIYRHGDYYLDIDKIIYIDVHLNMTRIHMLDDETGIEDVHEILKYPLKKIMNSIEYENTLLHCHKGYIINPDFIVQYHPDNKVELKYISKLIPIGRTYISNFNR